MSRKHHRVVLKISGESFAAEGSLGISPEELMIIADEISEAHKQGAEIAVVVGGGNIIRGAALATESGFDQSTSDYMGMLGTVINGLALKEALESRNHEARVMSAINLSSVAESFIRARALRHLEKNRIVILVAGTGNPFFTTDTCAALRSIELGADILLKATKVDGIYDKDPATNPDATRFEDLTFNDAIKRRLKVMDLTAMTMCMEHRMPICVFDFKKQGNIQRVVAGDTSIGTLVTAPEAGKDD
ncbi:MAG: UMP kinase [Planctomycetota bacterium]|nr:UMP kinase [Planctomycetota bacterium]MEC9234558.1 UMP kinase [Planctomycetota bacterium]MED5506960.1 UMP kinase [Planctomycetota bacterium]MED6307506.1 UMP kinase [Planctomycetota bacterium]